MMNSLALVGELIRETFKQWREEDITRLGAALAYFAAFSVIPLLLLFAAVAGALLGENQVELEIVQRLREFIGPSTAETVQTVLQTIYADKGANGLTTIVSVIALLYGATGLFRHLKSSLNVVWNVSNSNENKIRGFVKDTVLSFIAALGMGLGLFLVLGLNTVLFTFVRSLNSLYPEMTLVTLWQVLGVGVLLGVATLVFGVIYKLLPDAQVTWHDVWVGASISALLLTASQFVLSVGLSSSSLETIYGAASMFMFILIWVYISAHIVLIGAEFTQVYANRAGSKIIAVKEAQ
jgi:membrane protein